MNQIKDIFRIDIMKKIISSIIFCTIGFITIASSHAEISFEQELQQGCTKIKQYANNGKKFYDQKQYPKALVQFKQQAAWSQFCLLNTDETAIKTTERDVAIAYNNVGLSYAKMNQPLWARAWYLLNIRDEIEPQSTRFNLQQLPKPKPSTDLSGQYVRYADFGEWNHLTVKKNKVSYQIEFDGLYMGIRSLIYGPNMGQFSTSMPLSKKQTVYRYEDCQIDLNFKRDTASGNTIKVTQNDGESGCGFGHNVYADGVYFKVENNADLK